MQYRIVDGRYIYGDIVANGDPQGYKVAIEVVRQKLLTKFDSPDKEKPDFMYGVTVELADGGTSLEVVIKLEEAENINPKKVKAIIDEANKQLWNQVRAWRGILNLVESQFGKLLTAAGRADYKVGLFEADLQELSRQVQEARTELMEHSREIGQLKIEPKGGRRKKGAKK